jgi:hypothetical protein
MLLHSFRPVVAAPRRMPKMWPFALFCSLWFIDTAQAGVTVYGQLPLGQATMSAASANYTGAAAYDSTVLNAPAIPNPAPPTQPSIQLFSSNTSQGGLSIPLHGSFFGFSIEMSVVNQVRESDPIFCFILLLTTPLLDQLVSIRERIIDRHYDNVLTILSSTYLQVSFLNLMANLKQRGGGVHIRVGGNTQETATVVDSIPGGKVLTKDKVNSRNPVSFPHSLNHDQNFNRNAQTQTPALLISPEMIYMMNNVSSLVGIKWYLGI